MVLPPKVEVWYNLSMTFKTWILPLSLLLLSSTVHARNFPLKGKNDLCGGFGVSGAMTDWTPGGFKWFNEYSRQMSQLTWLNFQLNLTTGSRSGGCHYDDKGRLHCDSGVRFNGTALEMGAGVKFKWRLKPIPLQFHAKVGGVLEGLFFEHDFSGIGFGVRGGAGARYFFVPSFGVGLEIIHTIGPAIINNDVGPELMNALDFHTGVEWRF